MAWSIAVARRIIINNLADELTEVDAGAIEQLIRQVDEELHESTPPAPVFDPEPILSEALI